ncbi:ARS binding protein 2-domain-containing protein [Microdochium trichocladiopsis]|uniref:ARS binding protein 2-domain-containing protein n=1 Tax=Microdochium trichocladiopsis TaxID=1682393 RepID=A0A9P9BTK2_9PEZI|nr:ARS binding protein 2-domain-containing protein [Microdochium trichocladiopsis]KAH7040076.1 ARS binding protein 2-domain-containing protein [Microdochium trichocladiopsis]
MPAMALSVPPGGSTDQAAALQPSRSLPTRQVVDSNIEDVFVSFILYCNPAVPAESSTEALREAFRSLPKSGGKAFSAFALFELVKKLTAKELKTWAEVVIKLGVDPPDVDKGESVQKIQQYAVRLKRWMHALHVDAFFDFLIGIEHVYWVQVPFTSNPIAEDGRDGVAAEDDMALRALLPHIKPKRGRRKPEDDLSKSPAQRARLRSPSVLDHPRNVDPWTAHPDTARSFVFPPVQSDRQNPMQVPQSAYPWHGDAPMSAFPQSALGPGTTFWGDPTEPQSAITPSRSRANPRRHGAKVVSSAWRNSMNASGRGRGRPPTNSKPSEPMSAHPDLMRSYPGSSPDEQKILAQSPPALASVEEFSPVSEEVPPPALLPTNELQGPGPQATRPTRPNRLSLQVPERQGGSVRLATPPAPAPPVVITPPPVFSQPSRSISHARQRSLQNGTQYQPQNHMTGRFGMSPKAQYRSLNTGQIAPNGARRPSPSSSLISARYESIPRMAPAGHKNVGSTSSERDNTNCDGVESLLMMRFLTAAWIDPEGQPTATPEDMEEVRALVSAIISGLRRRAPSGEAFLMNLSGLLVGSWAGGIGQTGLLANNDGAATTSTNGHQSAVKRKSGLTIQKLEVATDYTRYECRWEMKYGDIVGHFSHDDVIPHSRWKRGYMRDQSQQLDGRRASIASGGSETAADSEDGSNAVAGAAAAAEFWKKKFATLAQTVAAMEQSP